VEPEAVGDINAPVGVVREAKRNPNIAWDHHGVGVENTAHMVD
jgi:hypothetical protein